MRDQIKENRTKLCEELVCLNDPTNQYIEEGQQNHPKRRKGKWWWSTGIAQMQLEAVWSG